MASSERSGKRPTRPSTAARPRRKAAMPPAEEPSAPIPPAVPPALQRKVAPLEGALSMVLGVLLVVAALFPRSIKQLLMLGVGGGLVVRGMTGHRGVSQSLGLDMKEPSA